MRNLPLLVLLLAASACGASVQPLAVAQTAIDASRAALPSACPYSTPTCDKLVASLNAAIAGYNVALAAQAGGVSDPATEQAVADASVSVLRAVQAFLPSSVSDGGVK